MGKPGKYVDENGKIQLPRRDLGNGIIDSSCDPEDLSPPRSERCRKCWAGLATVYDEDWADYDFGHGSCITVHYKLKCDDDACGADYEVSDYADFCRKKKKK